jgi:hypothetical protein
MKKFLEAAEEAIFHSQKFEVTAQIWHRHQNEQLRSRDS